MKKNKLTNIPKKVFKKLRSYEKLSFLECYAMFMGKAQLIEFGLKRLLIDHCGYKYEKVETKTLGWTIKELEKKGLREDFLFLLNNLLDYRNDLAHNFLVDQMIMNSILKGGKTFTKPFRHLEKALYEVEQVILIYDFTLENNGSFWKKMLPPTKNRVSNSQTE